MRTTLRRVIAATGHGAVGLDHKVRKSVDFHNLYQDHVKCVFPQGIGQARGSFHA